MTAFATIQLESTYDPERRSWSGTIVRAREGSRSVVAQVGPSPLLDALFDMAREVCDGLGYLTDRAKVAHHAATRFSGSGLPMAETPIALDMLD